MSDKIFVQIPSYMDLELYPTVKDILEKAQNPENIFLSIYCQDTDPPDLTPIFKHFRNTKYAYQRVSPKYSKGVGYARARANSLLTDEYKYYLQIDSHSRFTENWDKKIIEDYLHLHDHWGKMIFSVYPPQYYFDTGNVENGLTALKITTYDDCGIPFDKKYVDYAGGEYGQESGYMCAGFLFGYAQYIIAYDPYIYFFGEEHCASVRLFDEGIKIICPPSVYMYHDYDGRQRKRHWDKDDMTNAYETISRVRIRRFFAGKLDDEYGVSKETVNRYLEKFLYAD